MENPFKKPKFKKILLISAGALGAIIILALSTGYLILRGYVRKMNLVDLSDTEENTVEYEDNYDDGSYANYDGSDDTLYSEGLAEAETNTYENEDNISILSVKDDITDIPVMEDKDVLNILLIGSDSRDPKVRGRSDAMMILSVNKKNDKIILTSLLRDIYLTIPGKSSNRLNAAYAQGGAKLLIETIEQNFRIKIDKYVSVDFFAFMDVIDTIGGVTVEVTDEEIPYLNSGVREINRLLDEEITKDTLTTGGKLLLNGKQALGFSRIRYLGTDFARTARQRKIMEQIFNKLKKTSISNIINLLNTVLPKVTTNFTEKEIISHILRLPEYLGYDFEQLRIPANGSYENKKIKKMEVLVIDFEENVKLLQNTIYLTE